MLYLERSTVNMRLQDGRKAWGARLLDVKEDDQKGVSALNVAHAPMLRSCMRANQNARA